MGLVRAGVGGHFSVCRLGWWGFRCFVRSFCLVVLSGGLFLRECSIVSALYE